MGDQRGLFFGHTTSIVVVAVVVAEGRSGSGSVVVAVVVVVVVHPVFGPDDLTFLLGKKFTGYTHFAFLQKGRALVELDRHLAGAQHHPIQRILRPSRRVDVLEVDVCGVVARIVDILCGGVDINILDQVLRHDRLEAIGERRLVDRYVDVPHPQMTRLKFLRVGEAVVIVSVAVVVVVVGVVVGVVGHRDSVHVSIERGLSGWRRSREHSEIRLLEELLLIRGGGGGVLRRQLL